MADGTRDQEFKELEEGIIQKVKEIILECAISTVERLATEIADSEALIMQQSKGNLTTQRNNLMPKEDGGSNYQIAINFRTFDGTDLTGWLFKCEIYFQIVHTPVSIKVSLASLHFTGKSLEWQISYVKSRGVLGVPPWEDYVSDLKARFGVGDQVYMNPMAELKRLFQDGDLLEYIEAFDACAFKTNLSEENVLSCFVTGLKDEVRYPVLMQGPKTLQQAYALSRMQDACLTSLPTGKSTGIESQFGVPGQISGKFSKQTPDTPQGVLKAQATAGTGIKQNQAQGQKSILGAPPKARRLTEAEIAEKCLWCDEKYSMSHQCTRRYVNGIWIQEYQDDEGTLAA